MTAGAVRAGAVAVVGPAGGGRGRRLGVPAGVGHGRDHQVVAERGERDDDGGEGHAALAGAELHGACLLLAPYRAQPERHGPRFFGAAAGSGGGTARWLGGRLSRPVLRRPGPGRWPLSRARGRADCLTSWTTARPGRPDGRPTRCWRRYRLTRSRGALTGRTRTPAEPPDVARDRVGAGPGAAVERPAPRDQVAAALAGPLLAVPLAAVLVPGAGFLGGRSRGGGVRPVPVPVSGAVLARASAGGCDAAAGSLGWSGRRRRPRAGRRAAAARGTRRPPACPVPVPVRGGDLARHGGRRGRAHAYAAGDAGRDRRGLDRVASRPPGRPVARHPGNGDARGASRVPAEGDARLAQVVTRPVRPSRGCRSRRRRTGG